ncbi:MAG: response regulator transcription factor [Eubacteriaceae bacterium]|nr:response regulator transcription factor [Eubacteriaceae bacterium]
MIYLVEDDKNIRELVVYTLNNTGLKAQGFEKPSYFWKAMEQKTPSAIILDIMLPEQDGLEILKKLRASVATSKIPIIMLTAKDSEFDKVTGLDFGADDYVTKPFGMMELVARIKALMRRTEEIKQLQTYSVGELLVDPAKHIIKACGEEVNLTYKEFELLCFLMENQDHVFSRDQLLNKIWGYDFDGESRTVDVHIRSLRQKLGRCGDYIQTVRGIGYKMGETVI